MNSSLLTIMLCFCFNQKNKNCYLKLTDKCMMNSVKCIRAVVCETFVLVSFKCGVFTQLLVSILMLPCGKYFLYMKMCSLQALINVCATVSNQSQRVIKIYHINVFHIGLLFCSYY